MTQYAIDTEGQLQPHLQREWLLTNGLGGFAASTLVGCNTRRYHGLLVGATTPPVGRIMALNRMGELVHLDGRTDQAIELSVNQFRDRVYPRGEQRLRRFELDHCARWFFDVEGVRIIKEVHLLWQRNAVGIRYTIQSPAPRPVALQLIPFVSLRDFHTLMHSQSAKLRVLAEGGRVAVTRGQHTLQLVAAAAQFTQQEAWWFGHVYPHETERGMDDMEDLFQPGYFMLRTEGAGSLTLWASLDEAGPPDWDQAMAQRAASRPVALPRPTAAIERLARAADDFVVLRRRPDGKPATSIIAGYPWFADWGRDTMISLPGLLLTTARYREAAEALTVFADYVSEGMVPNVFDDYTNEPHYNTVDASLWFVHAAHEYLRASGDRSTFADRLLPACRAIVDGYRRGTRFDIRMDADGLIHAGSPGTQLTWMDAKHGEVVFTPRHGKAVEINALWHHVLKLMGEEDLAARVAGSFRAVFWRNPFRGLWDVVDGVRREGAVRPNQIFAVSLPHSPLDHDQQRAVVEVVRRELLTPFGLRTLARGELGYIGVYAGPPARRDAAYHKGTVWPWLIGPFLDAYLRVEGNSAAALEQARQWLAPLVAHLDDGCIGQISECFEGDPPHRPVAAFAQAWSVAETLRLAVRLGM